MNKVHIPAAVVSSHAAKSKSFHHNPRRVTANDAVPLWDPKSSYLSRWIGDAGAVRANGGGQNDDLACDGGGVATKIIHIPAAAVSTHAARSKSFHHPPRCRDGDDDDLNLDASASAYLARWFSKVGAVRANGGGQNDDLVCDGGGVLPPDLHPTIVPAPRTNPPRKQSSTPTTDHGQSKHRGDQDECETPVIEHTGGGHTKGEDSFPSNETYLMNSTALRHLTLGDKGSPSDMMFRDDDDGIEYAKDMESLRLHDFVFLLRTDGSWTYAIIADRSPDSILFVVDTKGNTKSLSKKRWVNSIRFVNPDAAAATDTLSGSSGGRPGEVRKMHRGK
jgi:hypothetical protein